MDMTCGPFGYRGAPVTISYIVKIPNFHICQEESYPVAGHHPASRELKDHLVTIAQIPGGFTPLHLSLWRIASSMDRGPNLTWTFLSARGDRSSKAFELIGIFWRTPDATGTTEQTACRDYVGRVWAKARAEAPLRCRIQLVELRFAILISVIDEEPSEWTRASLVIRPNGNRAANEAKRSAPVPSMRAGRRAIGYRSECW
jgi:hypothetical protein